MKQNEVSVSRTINTNGAVIEISEAGDGDPALVFLHYWGGSSRTWQGVIDRLGGSPLSIALSQRGWGGSDATDGRYDLNAMADDVECIANTLGLSRYVIVGHSMGGKVAQVVASRCPAALIGLVLVAPAPPTPMPVPEAQRIAMLDSYGSREGVEQALSVLSGSPLSVEIREQVIEDTLRGVLPAKRIWTEHSMIEDVSAGLSAVTLPVTVIIGDRDHVEQESALRKTFMRFLPQSTFRVLKGVGHLSPLEAPSELAKVCSNFIKDI